MKKSSFGIHRVYDFIDEIQSEDNDNEIKLEKREKNNAVMTNNKKIILNQHKLNKKSFVIFMFCSYSNILFCPSPGPGID